MKAFYSDRFVLPLPPGHRFPMAKYAQLREFIERELTGIQLHEPLPADEEQLRLAHDANYVRRVVCGELTAAEQRAIGFPWTTQMVERARRCAADNAQL